MALTKEQFDAKVKADQPVALDEFPMDAEVNMSNIGALIRANVARGNKEVMDLVLKEMNVYAGKEIFGTKEEDVAVGKSEIDTSVFSKHYNLPRTLNAKMDGAELGKHLLANGGAFLKLSPEMDTFAEMIKSGFNPMKIAAKGIDYKKYQETVAAGYKAVGMKATGMNETTSADGGATVPVEYAATVIEFAVRQSPLLQMVTRQTMASSSLKIPRLVQSAGSYFGQITLYWIDEAATKTVTKPQFEQLTFEAEKLIGLVVMTDELIADSNINIINYVTGLFTRAIQYEWERVILDGSGSGQPLGVINDPTINIVARAQENTVGYKDILDLEAALDENFIDLDWFTRKTMSTNLRNLRDNNNQLLFQETWAGMAADVTMQPRLHGLPVHYTRNVPSFGNKGDIVLGDWKHYILAPRQDITIDTSMHAYFTTDETAIRFVCRVDGMPGVPEAFAILDEMRS